MRRANRAWTNLFPARHGADLNGRNYASGDPVYSAYDNRDRKMITLLFSRGGTVGIDTAAFEGDEEQTFRLLEEGRGDPAGLIGAAICGGNPAIVERVLGQMDLEEIEERSYGLLTECMRFWRIGPYRKHRDFDTDKYFTIATMLLEAGADPNGRARWNRTELIELLLAWGGQGESAR